MSGPEIVPFEVTATAIDGLWLIRSKAITDSRGTIREIFRASEFSVAGLPDLPPVQINLTETRRGAIRGLHGEAMQKLVGVVSGEAFGAYVDAREDSSTRGTLVTVTLTQGMQVLVPNGVCNGFQAVEPEVTQYLYCFDNEWVVGMAGPAINPFDADLAIPWPLEVAPDDALLVSEKDRALPSFREVLGEE